jgi:hypothetical protein
VWVHGMAQGCTSDFGGYGEQNQQIYIKKKIILKVEKI